MDEAAPDLIRTDNPIAEPAWGLGDVLIGFALANVLSGAALVVMSVLGLGGGGLGEDSLDLLRFGYLGTVVFVTTTWAGLGGWSVIASRLRGSGKLSVDFGLRFRWPADAIIGVVAALGLLGINVAVDALFAAFGVDAGSNGQVLFPPVSAAWQPFVLAFLVVLGTPIVEEVFFRGLLLRSLLKRRLRPAVAIGLGALAFGLPHAAGPPATAALATIVTILYGLAFGVMAWKTGRLGAAIVAHAIVNAAALAGFLLA